MSGYGTLVNFDCIVPYLLECFCAMSLLNWNVSYVIILVMLAHHITRMILDMILGHYSLAHHIIHLIITLLEYDVLGQLLAHHIIHT
jgi:hypothetical protein